LAEKVVTKGACIQSLAKLLKFRNYHSIYDFAGNSKLKTDRPNANALLLGDVVKYPDAKGRKATCAVGRKWTLVVKRGVPASLRIVLLDKDDKPISGRAWEMKGGLTGTGTTKADGLIEIKTGDVIGATSATLIVKAPKPAPPKAAAPAKPPATPPVVYPPKVKPPEFTDKNPDPKAPWEIEWTLEIGALASFNTVTGVTGRLQNFGYGCKELMAAVKRYQKKYKQAETGDPESIEADLMKRHDSPP
jgi:hypothetical protein